MKTLDAVSAFKTLDCDIEEKDLGLSVLLLYDCKAVLVLYKIKDVQEKTLRSVIKIMNQNQICFLNNFGPDTIKELSEKTGIKISNNNLNEFQKLIFEYPIYCN